MTLFWQCHAFTTTTSNDHLLASVMVRVTAAHINVVMVVLQQAAAACATARRYCMLCTTVHALMPACRHRQIYEPNTLEITEDPALSTECFVRRCFVSTALHTLNGWMVGRELCWRQHKSNKPGI